MPYISACVYVICLSLLDGFLITIAEDNDGGAGVYGEIVLICSLHVCV